VGLGMVKFWECVWMGLGGATGGGGCYSYKILVLSRFQLAKQLAITPDIQYIKNPALNPTEDDLVILGLRSRFAF